MRARMLLLGALLLPAAGCFPYHHHHHMHGGGDPVEDACLVTACLTDVCIVDTCLNPPRHEYRERYYEHHHGPRCGCPQRWEGGHVLYWYGGHWEYEDGATCPY